MPEARPERRTGGHGAGRWAAVHLIVALVLILAIVVLRLWPGLDDAADLFLLAGTGVLALVLAGLLFGSFLRR